ncbi:Hypothetical predicted protein [Mytilus galloprovincialis]|uniref:Uncharacterized protein n=1 Tax=Mytilus galloprovincialis TaxID=29158 RepID=A0A8B6CGY8_MYTGA|nr:Hypothetical predicted protein [Mytilus galloprovincialis]
MCLNCTLGPGILKLTCKIDKLHLPVSFHNNFGKEIAFCSLPFPSPLCISGYKNTTVRQNIHTNETVVTIREIIDQRINGNWSCLHGYGRDMYEADFEINIPILEGQHKREQTGDLLSPKKMSWYTIAGISISVITLTIVGGVLGIYIYKVKCFFRSGQLRQIDGMDKTVFLQGEKSTEYAPVAPEAETKI